MNSKSKQINTKLARRLMAAGCPIPWGEEDPNLGEPDLTFEITQPALSRAYDRQRRVEYVFPVRLVNHSYNGIQLQRFCARVPWRHRLYWPGLPEDTSPETQVYRFVGGQQFPSSSVLNHRLGQLGNLAPGTSWEGLLLAYSISGPLPGYVLHETAYRVRLLAVDQYRRWHGSYIDVTVDRTATLRPAGSRRPGKGLFDDSEPVNPFWPPARRQVNDGVGPPPSETPQGQPNRAHDVAASDHTGSGAARPINGREDDAARLATEMSA